MRNSLFRAAVFAGFLLPVLPTAGDSPTIISEWDASIQIIRTEDYTGWPGIESRVPIDVSAEADRIWLIWPDAILNLDKDGHADPRTLLALFASTARSRNTIHWSAEAGIICSDGIWRSADLSAGTLTETDTFSGITTSRRLEGIGGGNIYPTDSGNLLVLGESEAYLVISGSGGSSVPETRLLETDLPPLSMVAVSRDSTLAARAVPGEHVIKFSTLPLPVPGRSGKEQQEAPDDIRAVGDFWMMDWAGNLLVLAGPGRLAAIDPSGRDYSEMMILEDPRLPRRWYRIRGGQNRLLVLSPESGLLAVVRPTPDASAGDRQVDFAGILEQYALEAGRLLEDAGLNDRAIAYYNWILPLVRSQRSRQPTVREWPELEGDISDRRALLSGNW